MLDRFERDELIESITKSLQIKKKKKRDEEDEPEVQDDRNSFEIPLDEVLPPSHGRESGDRGMGSPHRSDFVVENLENRLLRIFENLNVADDDPNSSESENQSVDVQNDKRAGQKQVGTTEVLGHSKASKDPSTPAKAQQQENSPFAKRGKAVKDAKKKEGEGEDSEDMLQNAMDQLGMSGETQTPS